MERAMDQGMPERDDPVEAIYLAEGDTVSGSHIALLSAHISRLASQIAALTDAVSSLTARVEQPTIVVPEPVVSEIAALTNVVASLVARVEQPPPLTEPEPIVEPAPVRVPDVEPQAAMPARPRPFRPAFDATDDWPTDADLRNFSSPQRGGTEDIW